jgi:hypothetical protein
MFQVATRMRESVRSSVRAEQASDTESQQFMENQE